MNRQYTYEEMKAALDASRLPPLEHCKRMVRRGIVNSEGKLTKLYGGEAEVETEYREPNKPPAAPDSE